MFIVRWLLGNPIVATWMALACSVIATLLFFGVGSGNKEVLNTNTSAITSAKKINNDDKKVATTTVNTRDEQPLINDTNKKVESDSNRKKEIPSSDKNKKVAMTSPAAVAPVKSKPDETTKPAASTKKPAVNMVLDENNATTDLSQVTTEEMLLMAREAYWNNGLDEAAQIYKKLIKNEPEVLEYKGELGNVYWRQGYPEKAAELYSEIAIPMIEKGRSDKVANMIGFIGLFYPDRAAEIHRRMQSTK